MLLKEKVNLRGVGRGNNSRNLTRSLCPFTEFLSGVKYTLDSCQPIALLGEVHRRQGGRRVLCPPCPPKRPQRDGLAPRPNNRSLAPPFNARKVRKRAEAPFCSSVTALPPTAQGGVERYPPWDVSLPGDAPAERGDGGGPEGEKNAARWRSQRDHLNMKVTAESAASPRCSRRDLLWPADAAHRS